MKKCTWSCEKCGKYQKKNLRVVKRFCSDICAVTSKDVHKWTPIEDKILTEVYNTKNRKEIMKIFPKRSWLSITNRAIYYLKLNRKSDRCWTKEEIKLLLKNYQFLPTEEIIKIIPRKTYTAIKLKAIGLGLTREYHKHRNGNVRNLLNETPEAYYWIGFLLADGHFSNKGKLSVTLSIRDEDHLRRLSHFLECHKELKLLNTRGKKYISLNVYNSLALKEICDKFNISNRKTYHPPDISNLNGISLLSIIIGFIDGDGCIKKQSHREDVILSIKCHSSWLIVLQIISDFLYGEVSENASPSKAYINSRGYAILNIGNSRVLSNMKDKIIELGIPHMERKWNIISKKGR